MSPRPWDAEDPTPKVLKQFKKQPKTPEVLQQNTWRYRAGGSYDPPGREAVSFADKVGWSAVLL